MPDIAGLKLIVPTSATATGAGSSGSVSATGKVTWSTAATLAIDGCFSATYDNYLIVIRYLGSTNLNIRYQLRAAGSDATGTNYTYQYLLAGSTTVSGARTTSSDRGSMGGVGTAYGGEHLYFYGPYLAQPTASRNVNVSSISDARIDEFVTTHSLSTSYDGFKFFPTSGTFTGSCTVYGLSQ